MRANERKGAWTLLICVLLFGALVWGLGARRMREDGKLPAKVETLDMNADSVAADDARGTASAAAKRRTRNKKGSAKSAKSAKSGRSAKSGSRRDVSTAAVRDILSDTIPSESGSY